MNDYSSIYTIKDFYQTKILPLYFDEDKLALSSVGDLGMFLDITSSTTEDMINIATRYINEIMPGQANLPEFIYTTAANYGITNILAYPAKMSMLLLIKEIDIINNSIPVEDHNEFTIDSDLRITVDDLQYRIPYNIKIRSTYHKGEYNHMSFYDITYNNEVSSESIPFIKTMKTDINGDIWLVLRVNTYQYELKKYTEPIITNSILNIPYIDLSFENQLCNFEAFYTPAGGSIMTQLEKRAENTQPTTSPFIYYKLTGDNSIRLSFANDDRYFIPDYNSTITVYMYETSGSLGNFGLMKDGIDIIMRASTEDESIAYNRSIYPQGLSQGNSTGGRDQLTLDNIKLLTGEKQTTVNSYTTENDLNTYFTNFATIYNHDGIFVKQRDDYAGREYGCFIKLSHEEDILPTNTLNMRLLPEDMDLHYESLRQWSIDAGTIFQYEPGSSDVIVKKTSDATDDEIEYATMALMVITTKPNKVNYYMNTINKLVEVDYTYFNLNSIFNFVVQNCTIKRDAIHGDNSYHIELELARLDGVFNDIQSQDFMLQSTNGEISLANLEVLIIFDTSVGNYVRMTCTADEIAEGEYLYNFTADFGTTDMVDDERILITQLQKREDDSEDERLIDMMNPQIKFAVFYKYDSGGGGHDYSDIGLVKDHMLCNLYTPQENEFYFAYPLNLIRSHVMFEDRADTSERFGFYVKQVPVFGKSFLLDELESDTIDSILTDISGEHTFLTNMVDLLHGAFTINMKFYNTYGKSRSFYIGYGTDKEIINHVNCRIELGIKFYDGIIVSDYITEIKNYIKDFFESINKLSTGTNQAFISVLDQQLHNNFADQIKYTIFYSINGYESKYQVIEMINNMNENPSPNFVPEYLTLLTDDIIITPL